MKEKKDLTACAIDIGSNAIRFAIGSLKDDGSLKILNNGRKPVSLGRSVFVSGDIDPKTMSRAQKALEEFVKEITPYEVDFIRAVGTSALREADNREEFISTIKAALALNIEAISGEDEAALIIKAVQNVIDLRNKVTLHLDIGGGSIEVSLLNNEKLLFAKSEKLGAVRLLKNISKEEHAQETFARFVRMSIASFIAEMKEKIPKQVKSLDLFIGTGGNIEALGELRVQLLEKKNPHKLKIGELESLVETIKEMSFEDRMSRLGLREDRADVILPASLLLLEVFKAADIEVMAIPNVGLKEGVLIDLLKG